MTSRIITVPRSMTREEWVEEVLEVVAEMQDLVEVEEKLFVTTTKQMDTMQEIVPILPLHVSILSLMIIVLKNALFWSLRCRKNDRIWVITMSS